MVLPPFSHPIRCAERAAALDIISNGRLEFGTGRSATWTELGGFGCDPDMTKEMWDEVLHAIPKMWMQETFSLEREVLLDAGAPRHPEARIRSPTRPSGLLSPARKLPSRLVSAGIGCLGVSIGTPQEYAAARHRLPTGH